MTKHIVMWKLKDINDKNKIKELLEELPGKISYIKSFEVGINNCQSPFGYDIVLYSEFENADDLEKYRVHPDHVKAADFIKNAVTDRAVVDYEV